MLIADALRMQSRGLTGPELKTALAENLKAPESIRKHKSFLYTVLGQMVKARQLVKANDRYILIGDLIGEEKSEARTATNGSGLGAHAS